MKLAKNSRPLGVKIVALAMIIFGILEMVTGFTHNFFGVITEQSVTASYLGVALGACYFLGGALVLTARKWGAAVAVLLLALGVVGRIFMVLTGLFPIDTFKQTFSIIAGTSIAFIFAIYISIRWKSFK